MGQQESFGADHFYRCLRGAYRQLEAEQDKINQLNVFPVPDGDTGRNMVLTLKAALDAVEEARRETQRLTDWVQAAARGGLWGARGNSGVILSQLLQGWADGLTDVPRASPDQLAAALEQAVEAAYRAVMEPVEGTMLTVAKGAAERAREVAASCRDVQEILMAAADGARTALAATPLQLEVLRRAGVVDAGGAGLVAILTGALRGLDEETRDGADGWTVEPALSPPRLPPEWRDAPRDAGLTFTYCTEFILQGHQLPREHLRQEMATLGDSVLVVGDNGLLKFHLHTNRPGRALEIAMAYGHLTGIQISNMEEQIREREAISSPAGLVAVVPGSGLADVFRSLGVEQVIRGGQTMNPRIQDIAEAIAQVPSPYVLVLPNNGNVILAAQQAARLVPDKRVAVIPSRTVPEGVAAVLAFQPQAPASPSADPLSVWTDAMESAMAQVRSGEVTRAERDFEGDGQHVRAGEFIGLDGDAVLAAGTDREAVACRVVAALGGDDADLITFYYGDGVTAADAEKLASSLKGSFPQAEVEFYFGGQPHYPYLISVE